VTACCYVLNPYVTCIALGGSGRDKGSPPQKSLTAEAPPSLTVGAFRPRRRQGTPITRPAHGRKELEEEEHGLRGQGAPRSIGHQPTTGTTILRQ
jgi:hypothetical protein